MIIPLKQREWKWNNANSVVVPETTIATMAIGISIKRSYNSILTWSKELSWTTAPTIAYQCIATPEPPNIRTLVIVTTTTIAIAIAIIIWN